VTHKLRLILLIIGTSIVIVSAILIVVDGIAIIFTYASLIFVITSIGVKNKKILGVYCLVFIIANLIFGWRIYTDKQVSNNQVTPLNHTLFLSCSNKMFQGVSSRQAELTIEQKNLFDQCMKQETQR